MCSSRGLSVVPGGVNGESRDSDVQQQQQQSQPAPTQQHVSPTQGEVLQQQRRDMAMLFTCTKCDTRSAKSFSRHSYEKGVVLVRCPGCQVLHLIADHLGWFGDSFRVEDLASEAGVEVKRVDTRSWGEASDGQKLRDRLSGEDLAGHARVAQLIQATGLSSPPGGSSSSSDGGGGGGGSSSSGGGGGGGGGGGAALAAIGRLPGVARSAPADGGAGGDVLEVSPEDVGGWQRVRSAHLARE